MIVTAATNDNKYIDIYDTRASNFNYRDGLYVTQKSAVENSGLPVCAETLTGKGLNYSNFARFDIISKLMIKYTDIKGFIWLDADTIVRKDIKEMINFPETDRCILRIQEREREGEKSDGWEYNNGVFAINNTPQSIAYLRGVYESCNKEGGWLSGQRQMYYLAKDMNIIVEPFDWRWNDSGFRKKASIWHSKGKFYSERWQKEFKHYLGIK